MKYTTKSASGTSFFGDEFHAKVSDLRIILGLPKFETNDGKDKTNFDWIMETESGEVFTVYDWKYYRPLDEDEMVQWHIGGNSGRVTKIALEEITNALSNLYNS
jgi:hypothetical protein